MTRGSPEDTCGDHGGRCNDGSPCGRAAGWGTDFDTGKCRQCRGTKPDGTVPDDHGAPEGNGNAQKHSLHADRGLLYDRLSEGRQELVDEWEAALIERYQEFHGREPDRADVEDLFELAVGYAQRRIARSWLAENAEDELDVLTEEMVVGQREDGSPITVEVPSNMLDAINQNRREDRLTRKDKGLERDPDTQQAEATATLAEVIDDD
jgi:hypothetical protein